MAVFAISALTTSIRHRRGAGNWREINDAAI
jgi:hypothetical protein